MRLSSRNLALLLLPFLLPAAHAHAAAQPAPELLWTVGGFSAPESVVYDRARDRFYVSNMATRGDGAIAGDGFISRLDGRGNITELKWITGLQNPKGLALANGRLYAGDDDALVEMDLDGARIVARHAPDDGGPAQFNDVTADARGNVYAFSGRLDTVFRLSDGVFAPWAKVDTDTTGKFNGVRADGLYRNVSEYYSDWDSIWDAATSEFDGGWIAEYEIPFKSLSFDPNSDTWGLNFSRS